MTHDEIMNLINRSLFAETGRYYRFDGKGDLTYEEIRTFACRLQFDLLRKTMDLHDCFELEDMFPKSFTDFEERSYGILFYNTQNKDSYDSNHAVIFRDRIQNITTVLKDIVAFYREKNLTPMIYQSALDRGYFPEITKEQKDNLSNCKNMLEKEGK